MRELFVFLRQVLGPFQAFFTQNFLPIPLFVNFDGLEVEDGELLLRRMVVFIVLVILAAAILHQSGQQVAPQVSLAPRRENATRRAVQVTIDSREGLYTVIDAAVLRVAAGQRGIYAGIAGIVAASVLLGCLKVIRWR